MYSKVLNDDDQVLIIRPSTIYSILIVLPYLLAPVFFFIILQLLLHEKIMRHAAYIATIESKEFVLVSLAIAFIGIFKALRKTAIIFHISKQQIKVEHGLLSKHIDYLELYRVKDYIVDIPFLFRIFNLMNFTVLSVDENRSNKRITMPGIKITNLQAELRDLVQQARADNNIYGVESQSI